MINDSSLRRTLKSFFEYYHGSRTHLALAKDAPEPRPIQPRQAGRVVEVPKVGRLHHRYERRLKPIPSPCCVAPDLPAPCARVSCVGLLEFSVTTSPGFLPAFFGNSPAALGVSPLCREFECSFLEFAMKKDVCEDSPTAAGQVTQRQSCNLVNLHSCFCRPMRGESVPRTASLRRIVLLLCYKTPVFATNAAIFSSWVCLPITTELALLSARTIAIVPPEDCIREASAAKRLSSSRDRGRNPEHRVVQHAS